MTRRRSIPAAIAVALLCCAVTIAGQTQSAVALPEALRSHLNSERLEVVTSIRGLPLGVRDELQTLFGTQSLEIAEPGAEFQVTDAIVNARLPIRRLIRAGCSTDHCLVYYERGGVAHTWHVALFHWSPQATRFEFGGIAPSNLTTIDGVKSAVLSGTIKSANRIW